jgi:uncharacterized protein
MKFAEDHNDAQYKITAYDAQGIYINGRLFERSVLLSPMRIINDWQPKIFTEFEADHLDPFYSLKPEVIILGTGSKQIFPQTEILRRLTQEKIGFEIMDTQAACRTFNIIMAEGRNVVAGFFIT